MKSQALTSRVARTAFSLNFLLALCGCPPREDLGTVLQADSIATAPDNTGATCPEQKSLAGPHQTLNPAKAPDGPGLVYVFPGIEGNAFWLADARRGYRDGGVTAEIRQFDWGRPLNTLANLTDLEGNRKKAAAVAAELAEWRAEHPHDSLDLVGYSGGGGMLLLALENMPPTVRVRNVLLVQPATNPKYNLVPALTHVDGRLTHFYSPSDGVILGWGTTTFGTTDRTYGPAAGKVGFDLVAAVADESLRGKFVQTAWSPAWREAGHSGDHISMLSYRWNRAFVAPAILGHARGTHPAGL